jgi:hypothetical protein
LSHDIATLNAARSGVPALERTLGHLTVPTIAQRLAVTIGADPEGQPFDALVLRDIRRVVTLRSTVPMLELGIQEVSLFGAVSSVVHKMGDNAPFNPADLPHDECLKALFVLGQSRKIELVIGFFTHFGNVPSGIRSSC